MKAILLCAAVAAACCSMIRAQPFAVERFTIDGGGGASTGGVYSVSGTVGQPEAGATMSGGDFSIAGGFWNLFAVAHPPEAPLLSIASTSTGTVVVFWPSSSGFTIQQNSDLTPAGWVTPLETVMDDGTNKFMILSPATGHRFFRLAKP